MSAQPLASPAVPAWCRYVGADGGPRVGAIDPAAGRFVDLGPLDIVALLAAGCLRAADLAARIAKAPTVPAPTRFLPPVPRGGKILCLAKNYVAHAKEFGA